MKPIKFLREWAMIIEDLVTRRGQIIFDDCDVVDFDQTWSSTALGFGGVGGSAMTKARTYIIIDDNHAYVYFSGHYAYTVDRPFKEVFWSDIGDSCMANIAAASTRY